MAAAVTMSVAASAPCTTSRSVSASRRPQTDALVCPKLLVVLTRAPLPPPCRAPLRAGSWRPSAPSGWRLVGRRPLCAQVRPAGTAAGRMRGGGSSASAGGRRPGGAVDGLANLLVACCRGASALRQGTASMLMFFNVAGVPLQLLWQRSRAWGRTSGTTLITPPAAMQQTCTSSGALRERVRAHNAAFSAAVPPVCSLER